MPDIGPRQTEILTLLAAGPYSLAALIAAVDASRPTLVMACLKRLQARGVVEMSPRKVPKRTTGVLVSLADGVTVTDTEPESRVPSGGSRHTSPSPAC